MYPEHLKYAHTHEWFFYNDKFITVGLSEFIIDKLDRLLFLDLPKVGDEILSGISFGEIESLEMLIDITSTISGEVIAVNERLYENLDILNRDPYKQGWFIKFVTNESHLLNQLLSAQEYEMHIRKSRSAAIEKQHIKGKRRK